MASGHQPRRGEVGASRAMLGFEEGERSGGCLRVTSGGSLVAAAIVAAAHRQLVISRRGLGVDGRVRPHPGVYQMRRHGRVPEG